MKSKSLNSMLAAFNPTLRASVFLFVSALSANALPFTWNGGGIDNKATSAANWVEGTPSGGANAYTWNATSLIGAAIDWDLSASINPSSFTFADGSIAYSFSGSNIQFVTPGTAISNNSTNIQTIANTIQIFFDSAKTFDAGSGGLALRSVGFRGDLMTAVQTNTLNLTGASNGTISGVMNEVAIPSGAKSALTKNGAGTWTLSGANTFTGAVTVNGGSLKAGIASVAGLSGAFGLNTAVSTANVATATLDLNGFATQIGSLAGAGGKVTLGSAILTTGGNNTDTNYAGVISGDGSMKKIGSGNQSLTGANTYTGGTAIDAGSLSFRNVSSKPGTGTITVAAGATIGLGVGASSPQFLLANINSLFAGTLAGVTNHIESSVGIDTTSAAFSYGSNTPANTRGLTKLGGNALTLSGNNLHTGPTRITAGTLNITTSANLGNANTLIFDGGTLGINSTTLSTITGGFLDTHPVTLTPGKLVSFSILDAAHVFTVGETLNHTTGGFDKTGPGTLVLSGPNTYTGKSRVLNGTLSVSSFNSLTTPTPGGSSNLGVPASAALGIIDLGSATATGNLLYTGSGETTDRGINLSGTTGSAGINQSGTGALQFTSNVTTTNPGAKTLTLSGSTAGTGEISGAVSDGITGSTVLSAAFTSGLNTITLSSVSGLANGVAISGTGIAAGTTVASFVPSTRVVTLSTPTTGTGVVGQTMTLPGVFNPNALTKSGTGSWTLSGASTYSGTTTVQNGTLTLSGNRTASSGAITVASASASPILEIKNGNFDVAGSFIIGQSASNSTVDHSGGTLTGVGGNGILLGNGTSTATYNLSGGSLTGSIRMGVNTATTGTNLNTFNLSGTGALTSTSLQIGRADVAGSFNTENVFNQTGGTATVTALSLGGQNAADSAATSPIVASLNLTAGTFSATNFTNLSGGGSNTSTITIGGTAIATLPAFPTTRGDNSTATITFDGGTLIPAAASTTYMSGLTRAFVSDNGAEFNVPEARDITIAQALENAPSAVGHLTKSGIGSLTLTGANTYSGNTTVEDGVLSISNTDLADTSTLIIGTLTASPAVLNLPNSGTDVVASLVIDGVVKPDGLYDQFNSDGAISGPGKIQVGEQVTDPYTAWIDSPAYNNPPLTADQKLPNADPDHDGIHNLLEFTLGGNPAAASQSILPTLATIGTNQVLSYKRSDASESPVTVQIGQWSTNLTTWTDVTPVLVHENDELGDDMTVTVPNNNGVGGKLFLRLNVTQ